MTVTDHPGPRVASPVLTGVNRSIASAEHDLRDTVALLDALRSVRTLAIHAITTSPVDDIDDLRQALAGDPENVARLDVALTIINAHLTTTTGD